MQNPTTDLPEAAVAKNRVVQAKSLRQAAYAKCRKP